MRLKLYSLLLVSATLLFGLSFQSCNDSAPKAKKTTSKVTNSKKMLPAAKYWAAAKKNLGISQKQVDGIKSINAKYGKKINALKKAKKWDGKANLKTQKTTISARSNELKKLLGGKFQPYQKFMSKHGIKQPAKKAPKKAGKKKPQAKKTGAKKPIKKKKTAVKKK